MDAGGALHLTGLISTSGPAGQIKLAGGELLRLSARGEEESLIALYGRGGGELGEYRLPKAREGELLAFLSGLE